MDSESTINQPVSPKPLRQLGRDEMNLVEFPITLLTDRVPKDQKEAVYQDEIYDERTGLTLTRKLTISAGNHGLTTAIDDEVILALIQITKNQNTFTKPKVEFCRHELIQSLNWPRTGASYDRLLLSLKRWTSVFLQYENAWRDNRTKTWVSAGFHIIDNYEITDGRTSGDQLDLLPSHIIWNKVIFESFQAGYLKPLDYDLCMGLSNSTAKRMYRFLDKRFHHKPDWTFDLKELAHEHIGLGRNYEGPAHLKRNLRPAIEELEAIGFLVPLLDAERFIKDGKTWKVRMIARSSLPALPEHEQQQALLLAGPAVPPSLVAELTRRGVTKVTAEDLVQQHPAERIDQKIELLDWLVEKQDKRIGKNPAGYLCDAIRKDYAVPKGFLSKAERQKREEAKQARERQAAEEHRQKQVDVSSQQDRRREEDAYWMKLTSQEQAELDAKALAEASETSRQSYLSMKRQGLGDGYLAMLRRQHIRALLDAEAAVEA
jgi:hypothetical protein